MTDDPTPADLERRLWREIDHVRTLMLGLSGDPPRHMQPMTAFTDEHDGTVWFYVRKDNDMLKEAGDGHAAMACLMTKDHSFIACIAGDLVEHYDRDRIERFWNPIAGAWFPEGKDDPNLTLLRFTPQDAQVWASQSNPIRFGFELAKAKLGKTTPDVGTAAHLNL